MKSRGPLLPRLAHLLLYCSLPLQRLCGALDLKSVQVWSPGSTAPSLVAQTLEGSDAAGAPAPNVLQPGGTGARAALSSWTFLGCYRAVGLEQPSQASSTPLLCALYCGEQGNQAAAMQGSGCFCLASDWRRLSTVQEEGLCDQACPAEYYSGTARLCGGTGQLFSVYQQYDFVHQTAQGCYDPWRIIWYQSVAVENIQYNSDGQVQSTTMQWHLHATSINSGDPLFPYQRSLEHLLVGMHYDLDNSRIVGLGAPDWAAKTQSSDWSPSVYTYTVNSRQENAISISAEAIPLPFAAVDVPEFLSSTGIAALDALHNIYYFTIPQVPREISGFGLRIEDFQMRLFGINLNLNEPNRFVLDVLLDNRIALLEVNSKFHDLFALMLENSISGADPERFMYVRLGASERNEATQQAQFAWDFTTPLGSVVNPSGYAALESKFYQIGISAVDHLSNTSFLLFKDLPHSDSPYHVQDINQRGSTYTAGYSPLVSPAVQATWLVNTDPTIPLTLAAPRLLSANFGIDARNIDVVFDSFTVRGALPVDSDGDFIPDGIDWTAQQLGMRECSDMFARQTAVSLGSMPGTACEWVSATTVRIHLQETFTGLGVGDGLFLKENTVYAHVVESNEWSMAASGGIAVGLPNPLDPPVVAVSFVGTVDLCSQTSLDAFESYKHGGRPQWEWQLQSIMCVNGRTPASDIQFLVEQVLTEASAGSRTPSGTHLISFGKDDLEPGCSYTIQLSVTGRWGLKSSKEVTVSKRPIPAPQILVQNPAELTILRTQTLTLQTEVEPTSCETIFLGRRTLRFLWTAEVQTGTSTASTVDLTQLVQRSESASLLVPPRILVPDATYTFRIRLGFAETWSDPEQSTYATVRVRVDRSPLVLTIRGGSRSIPKDQLLVLDMSDSLDPDFPADSVEQNSAWSFSYQCITEAGQACFPVNSGAELSNPPPCAFSTQSFQDLGRSYVTPLQPLAPGTAYEYYCEDTTKRGVLIVNMGAASLLPQAYRFTVIGSLYGRTATSSMVLQLTAATPPLADLAPDVIVEPLTSSTVPTTSLLRVQGDLSPEDKARLGDTVSWSWSFSRTEANPLWSQSAATEAAINNVAYLVPREILVAAEELDPVQQPAAFLSNPLASNTLVLRANALLPSKTYSFRLSATAPGDLVGYGDIRVRTAGPPPVPGRLVITPSGQSYSNEQKILTAEDWSADDLPLSYGFSYRTDLTSTFSKPVQFRVNPISTPTQRVTCMKAGEAVDSFAVEVTVTVFSNLGAQTVLKERYTVLPPLNPAAANAQFLEMAEQTAPESRPLLLGCVTLAVAAVAPTPASTPAPVDDNSTDVTDSPTPAPSPAAETPTPVMVTAEQRTANSQQADTLIGLLSSAADVAVLSPSGVSANLQAVQVLASSGTVTPTMVDFSQRMVNEVTNLADTAATDEDRDDIATQGFNTLGSMGFTSATSTDSGYDLPPQVVNPDSPGSGASFPAAPSTNRLLRRLQAGGQFLLRPSAFPSWAGLPARFHDPEYAITRDTVLTGPISEAGLAQEELELAWAAFLKATNTQDSYKQLETVHDEELFANYTAHLGAAERQTVLQAWQQEKERVRLQALSAQQVQARITRSLFQQLEQICSVLVKWMLSGENPKEFIFPMGAIYLGKSRDLSTASTSFSLSEARWKLTSDQSGAYGWLNIKFTQVNPLQWAPSGPLGPGVVHMVEVFSDAGVKIPVEQQATPLQLMAEQSSFAAGSCCFWDWNTNDNLGSWVRTGLLNTDNGCMGSHLSIVGMFMDFAPQNIELPNAGEVFLLRAVAEYNEYVVVALGVILALSALSQYWGFKQDAVDRVKPMEMRKTGDGVTQPKSQDDPVHYAATVVARVAGTFWNIVKRDHPLVSCFFRCLKLKVTRLQKVAVAIASLAGVAAVAALFFGEHVIDPKHFIEIGILSATITFPMVRVLAILFEWRPARDSTPEVLSQAKPGAVVGPLEAMPVTEEGGQEEAGPGPGSRGPSPGAGPGALGSSGGRPMPMPMPLPLPPLAPVLPAANGPEAGGGPLLAALPRVASGAGPGVPPAPPAPPGAPPGAPPAPPARTEGGSPSPGGVALQEDGEAPPPPPPRMSLHSADSLPPSPPPSLPMGTQEDLPLPGSAGSLMPPIPPQQPGPEADLFMPLPERPSTSQVALSQTQRQLLRRVRRMYIEKVLQNSERNAFDERVDMNSKIPHPMAQLATALAHIAVATFWIVASVLCAVYVVYFPAKTAERWAFSCISGWLFLWLVLETVKIALSTILELSEFSQRKRLHDPSKLKDRVSLMKANKMKKMKDMEQASKMQGVLPAPPDPPDSPDPPALGDASAG